MHILSIVAFVVLAPIALVLFAVTSAVSTVIGLFAAVRALTRRAPVAPPPGRDPAHLTGPVPRDAWRLGRAAVRAAHDRLVALPDPAFRDSLFARLWRRQSTRSQDGALILPPASLAGGYALGFSAVVLLIAITTAVHALLAGLCVLTLRATAYALRWAEIATRAFRGITIECDSCRRHVDRPAFLCVCGRIHRDLAPGDQGVLRRTCLCGHRLPTLLSNGKSTLPACCGECRSPLPSQVLSVPTAHFSVAGGAATGRTTFTRAALARLVPPPRRLVHLHDDCAFLALASGLIFVVDPFTLPSVSDLVAQPHHSRTDPKDVLDGVIETLTELRGTAIPLAIVITKADALPPPHHPYAGVTDPTARPAAARQWLLDHGRIDVLNTADNHFTRVRCFVVSAVGDDDDDPSSPVHWLLGRG